MNAEQSLKLRYSEKIESLSREAREKEENIKAEMNRSGRFLSGATVKCLFDLEIEYMERKLNSFLDSIKELIDLGEIKPSLEWQQRLLPELESWLNGFSKALRDKKPLPILRDLTLEKHRQQELDHILPVVGRRVRRRFDLMFYDEAAKAKMNRKGPITIGTLNVTGIANLGDIVGDINQSINQVEDSGGKEIAESLKELSIAILADPKLEDKNRQEAIENIRIVAEQASKTGEQRQLGIVKAALTYIPSVLSASTDVLNFFSVHLQDIQKFFGI